MILIKSGPKVHISNMPEFVWPIENHFYLKDRTEIVPQSRKLVSEMRLGEINPHVSLRPHSDQV